MSQQVLYEVKNRIATITLNRPEKRNALNGQMVKLLHSAFKSAEADEFVKVILLKANGKAFCAGADLDYLKQLQQNSFQDNLADSSALMELFMSIYRHPKVVVAQIEGHAIAGGAGLATVCDFAFSVPEAKFGYTEVRIGFLPAIVMFFLLRKIGETRAKELLLTGEIVDAETAVRYNMINATVEADRIGEHVQGFLESLVNKNSQVSMEFTKKMIGDVQSLPFKEALAFAARMNARARETDDCKKGISSFLNKEELEW